LISGLPSRPAASILRSEIKQSDSRRTNRGRCHSLTTAMSPKLRSRGVGRQTPTSQDSPGRLAETKSPDSSTCGSGAKPAKRICQDSRPAPMNRQQASRTADEKWAEILQSIRPSKADSRLLPAHRSTMANRQTKDKSPASYKAAAPAENHPRSRNEKRLRNSDPVPFHRERHTRKQRRHVVIKMARNRKQTS